jgi:hypothetical protein
MLKFGKYAASIFVLLGILFIPFPFHIIPFQLDITNALFKDAAIYIAQHLLMLQLQHPEISSDSTLFYILMGLLFLVSVFMAFLFVVFGRQLKYSKEVFIFIRKLATYYLAMQLMKYGFDKIFKMQFYLPEPNILYTPLGLLDKDILFWSCMGVSYSYTLFLGVVEAIAASMLLFKKTRTLGLLFVIAVLINVLAVNLCFDISVKIYTCFLLFLALFLLTPFMRSIYHYFILHRSTQLNEEGSPAIFTDRPFLYGALKAWVIVMVFVEAIYPALVKGNYNDDVAARPYLHGAYEVRIGWLKGKQVPSDLLPIKRIFIHRAGYIVYQNNQDEMQDYKLEINQASHQFLVTDYQSRQENLNYVYHEKEQVLEVEYIKGSTRYKLKAITVNWKSLPVLQHRWHWTIDEN